MIYIWNRALCELLSTASDDFHEITKDLTFTPDKEMSRMLCVNISVVNDNILEETEIFHVISSTSDDSVIFSRNTSAVFIFDDEGMLCMARLPPLDILTIIILFGSCSSPFGADCIHSY